MTVETAVAKVAQAGKYLSFMLGHKEYGLEILTVHQVNAMTGLVRLPDAPAFVRGAVTKRGRSIPVVSLRMKFGLPAVEDTEKTSIIVVKAPYRDTEVTMGLVVDEVLEVLSLGADQIETPQDDPATDPSPTLGLGRLDDREIILLDMDTLLADEDLEYLSRLDRTAAAGNHHDGGGR